MYSQEIEAQLKKLKIKIGDIVQIEKDGKTFEGMLMPRADAGDTSCFVIKLSTGYNAGVRMEGSKIKKIKEGVASFEKKQAPKKAYFAGKEGGHITLLSTGGTIASRIDYKTGAVDPQIDAKALVGAYPSLKEFEPIKCNSIFSILSEDMNPLHWEKIAQAVKDEFDDGAQGIVIAHGTDTMGYTAAALSYAIENLPAPVVITGAQRSPDRASSDAPQNIFCSMAAARANFAQVCLCMHATTSDTLNNLHIGTRVRKAHTSGRWAFKSIGVRPLGEINPKSGEVKLNTSSIVRDMKRKINLKNKFSANVHLAWIYPGINSKTVEKWAQYDGIVLAGTGLGHAPIDAANPNSKTSILPALRSLVDSGIPVAMAPQCGEGRVIHGTYSTGTYLANAGIIGNGADWLAETCYVKMCWALGQEKDAKKIKEIMLRPMHGDITSFSIIGEE